MLQGYPGVDLVGPDGPTYSLPRQSGDPQPLALAPGASASSRLTFSPTPNGWVPRTIVVTPPDATTQLETPGFPAESPCCGRMARLTPAPTSDRWSWPTE
jgi:hypothetical protein